LVRGAHFHARLGIQALRSSQVAPAIASLERAAELDPESAWVRYNLAVAYRAGGRLEETRRELMAALDLDPDYANAHFNLGTLLAAQGDFAAAEGHYQRVREIDPGDHLARMELAVAVSRLGDSARAQAELESLIRDAPGLIEARLALATLLAGQGRVQDAQSIVEEALTIDATDQELASAHTAAGRLLEGEAGEAEPHFRRAIELDPAAAEARFRLALGLGRVGRFSESAREFEQLIERVPGQPDYRVGLSMALLLAEEYPRARRSLEEARTRFPDSIDLAHSLARVLATCPDDTVRDGAAALELARALMEAQQSLDHAETLGMALAEVGRFDEAAELQRQVVAELERRGATTQLVASRHYLVGYGERRPVRAPWKGVG
jgi:Flp pilus assembly protein TadD